MALKKKPYKGCRDFFPKDMRVRNYLFHHMCDVAEKFGFEAYDGPLLEEVDLYKAKSGEELINDQIYSFTDRGERNVAIRPEMTPTVARMVANIHKQETKPIRWYSIPNLMRYEKPQRGRVREHWQFNVDIFGAPTNLGELEVVSLVIQFLKSFGAKSDMFAILLNDRTLVDAVFNDLLKLEAESALKLYKVIDKAKKVSPGKLDIMIREILLTEEQFTIFKEYLALNSVESLTKFATQNNIAQKSESFIQFLTMCQELELSEFIEYDPTIVRGLDYYTGVVFEIFDKHPDNNRAIAGGGAYANLLKIFNEEPLGGIGFGLGDVTLRDFLETHKLLPDLSKASHDVFVVNVEDEHNLYNMTISNQLRELGIKVESHLGKIKFNRIFKLAQSKGHSKILIIEDQGDGIELELKDLTTNKKTKIDINKINQIKDYIKG